MSFYKRFTSFMIDFSPEEASGVADIPEGTEKKVVEPDSTEDSEEV